MSLLERPALRGLDVHEHNSGHYLPLLFRESRGGVRWLRMRPLSAREVRSWTSELERTPELIVHGWWIHISRVYHSVHITAYFVQGTAP